MFLRTCVYLPTFYTFKAGVFSGSLDPSVWASTGIGSLDAAEPSVSLLGAFLFQRIDMTQETTPTTSERQGVSPFFFT